MAEDNPTLREFEAQVNLTRLKESRRLDREKAEQKSAEKSFAKELKEALQDETTRRNIAKQALRELQGEGEGERLLRLATDREGTIGFGSDLESGISIAEIRRRAWERE